MARELTFVLIGQSNMAGWTETRFRDLPNWMKKKPRNVRFYQFGRQMDFSQQPGGRFGPEVALSKFIAAYYPGRRINIIKLAVGGTSIYDWAKIWNPRVSFRMADSRIRNSLYALLKRQIELSGVLKNGKKVSAFIWMQGERDSRFPAAANAYLGNMMTLINDLRREYRSPHARFILGRINPPKQPHHLSVDIVRRAQEQVASRVRATHYITTDDLPKAADRVHYNTQGQIRLGRRFADEFRRMHG